MESRAKPSQYPLMKPNQPLIVFDQVTLRISDTFLFEGASWRILSGQHWAIIGPNGSGKTTLARALIGEIPVVGGRVSYPGLDDPAVQIGYISFERHRRLAAKLEMNAISRFFSHRLDDVITVRHELGLNPSGPAKPKQSLRYLLHRLNLNPLLSRPLQLLSTGERRKLLLAKTLAKPLRLLILDEPYDGLDTGARDHLNAIIENWLPQQTHLIVISHRPAEIPEKVSHFLVVDNGNIVSQGRRKVQPLAVTPSRKSHSPPAINTLPTVKPANGSQGRLDTGLPLIKMNNVSVSYGDQQILAHVDWQVKYTENWSVIGPNGSGKTTLLSLIAGDHTQAYANEIYVLGRRRGSGESIWELKQHIGMVSSEFQLRYCKDVQVSDVVLSGFFDSVGIYRFGTKNQEKATQEWMRFLGLQHLAKRTFMKLSYGEQRMVLLARAMVKSPQLLILDEPCEGLDHSARSTVLSLINAIGEMTATHLLYVTHYPEEQINCITHELQLIRVPTGGYTATCKSVKPASLTR